MAPVGLWNSIDRAMPGVCRFLVSFPINPLRPMSDQETESAAQPELDLTPAGVALWHGLKLRHLVGRWSLTGGRSLSSTVCV